MGWHCFQPSWNVSNISWVLQGLAEPLAKTTSYSPYLEVCNIADGMGAMGLDRSGAKTTSDWFLLQIFCITMLLLCADPGGDVERCASLPHHGLC
jgi:hypothetical protein